MCSSQDTHRSTAVLLHTFPTLQVEIVVMPLSQLPCMWFQLMQFRVPTTTAVVS